MYKQHVYTRTLYVLQNYIIFIDRYHGNGSGGHTHHLEPARRSIPNVGLCTFYTHAHENWLPFQLG